MFTLYYEGEEEYSSETLEQMAQHIRSGPYTAFMEDEKYDRERWPEDFHEDHDSEAAFREWFDEVYEVRQLIPSEKYL